MITSLCSIKSIENVKLFVNTESRAHTNQLYGLVISLLSSTLKCAWGDILKLIEATQILAEKSRV